MIEEFLTNASSSKSMIHQIEGYSANQIIKEFDKFIRYNLFKSSITL